MEFVEFAARAEEIEAETADSEITELVRSAFEAAGEDLPIVVRFLQGRVFPAWESTTLDVGPALCRAAIARAAGPNVSADDVEARLADRGDVGAVAASYADGFGGQRGLASFGAGAGGDGAGGGSDGGGGGRTVATVDDRLRSLAAAEGSGSRDRKEDVLFDLFNGASAAEARYLGRLVLSEMRIGVGEGTVRDAIATAFDAPVDAVERALQVTNDYGRVAELAREAGETGLDCVELRVGRPVQAMLAQAGDPADALAEWGEAAVETKFDGARVQLHHEGGEVAIFSRNMEDITDALPEVVERVRDALPTSETAVLDGEVVAVDDDGDPLPFQQVLRRFRRKHEVERLREEVPVEFRAFDCLRAGEDDLLDEPLATRRERLTALLPAPLVSESELTDAPEAVAAAEADALAAGHEGVMVKNLESAYSPGDRGADWLKHKPDVETLDLVVTGAEWGEGRRANNLGTFLLAARATDAGGDGDRDADDPAFRTIGKVATGITDEELAELTDLLEPEIVASDGTEVDIRPAVVFEVGYEEIQRSPTYSSGYALRFPRFRGVRDDMDPADADSLDRIRRLADGDAE